MKYFIMIAMPIIIITLYLYELLDKNKSRGVFKNNVLKYKYVKKSIMSPIEKKFYEIFKNILEEKYLIIPQVNLASIIKKENYYYTPSELFRNIDFGIYDKNTFELLLLIEINDNTHYSNLKTRIRDEKVKKLCNSVGYRLINFRLDKPNELWYMKKVLYDCLKIKENILCEECDDSNIQSKVSSN